MTKHIVFDLDGTLIDPDSEGLRPGAYPLLTWLREQGYELSLWTASVDGRTIRILELWSIRNFFAHVISRDDYDPECDGFSKDIRHIKGDVLVDDSAANVDFVDSIGLQGILVESYCAKRKASSEWVEEVKNLIHRKR